MDLHGLGALLAQVPYWTLLLGVGAIPGLLWLLGLAIVLRRTAPSDRARIIDAYGRALPWRRGPRP